MAPPAPPVFGDMVSSLHGFMKRIPDPRRGKRIKHVCAEVLTCLVLGFCAGRTTLDRALAWCSGHIRELRRHMGLENGIASDSTACRILKGIDAHDFADVFLQWASSLVPLKNACLIFDGKGLRAGARKSAGERTPYVMNIIDSATKLCLGMTSVGGKENEKSAFHRVLDQVDIGGSLILADAMATDARIMEHIIKNGGSFFFQVKRNNPETYDQLITQMDLVANAKRSVRETGTCDAAYAAAVASYSSCDTWERNRDRHEYRTCRTTNDPGLLDRSRTDLTFLKTLGVVRQTRVPLETDGNGNNVTPSRAEFMKGGSKRKPVPKEGDGMDDDISTVGIISDAAFDSETALAAKRTYWTIENCFHYVLDNVLREDRCTAKPSRTNRSILNRIAYNILRIVQIREGMPGNEMTKVSEAMCDRFALVEKYIFGGIASFH